MDKLTRYAYAKVNLSLDVTGRREDGYHLVKMIMQNVELHDDVTLEKCEEGFILTSNVDTVPTDDKNLMVKAAKLMFQNFNLPGGLKMHLEKRIPVAAGLAGGSTDAAAVINGINELFDLSLSFSELSKIGVKIGADVPYCILSHPALSEGIGEVLTKIEGMKSVPVLLCKIKEGASTKEVYQRLDALENPTHPDVDQTLSDLKSKQYESAMNSMGNILESVTIPMLPEIQEVKDLLLENGASFAMMSGSGPTVFSFFSDKEKAAACSLKLKEQKPQAFTCVTELMP